MIKALARQFELAPFMGAGTGGNQWQKYGGTSSHSNVGYKVDRSALEPPSPIQRLLQASQASPTSDRPRPGFGRDVGAVIHQAPQAYQMPIQPLKRRGSILRAPIL